MSNYDDYENDPRLPVMVPIINKYRQHKAEIMATELLHAIDLSTGDGPKELSDFLASLDGEAAAIDDQEANRG